MTNDNGWELTDDNSVAKCKLDDHHTLSIKHRKDGIKLVVHYVEENSTNALKKPKIMYSKLITKKQFVG